MIRLTHSTPLPADLPGARVLDHICRASTLWRMFPPWAGLREVMVEGHDAVLRLRGRSALRGITLANMLLDTDTATATASFSGPRVHPLHLISRIVRDDDTGGERLDEAVETISVPRRMQRAFDQWLRFRGQRVINDLHWRAVLNSTIPPEPDETSVPEIVPESRVFLLSGASGLVGQALSAFLMACGHQVRQLVRRPPRTFGEVTWDPAAGELDPSALDDVHAVIHLSGANVGQRWTPAHKKEVVDSRVQSTTLLSNAIAEAAANGHAPTAFICASGAGYYGADASGPCDESTPAGTNDFLAEVCVKWEAACQAARDAGVRTINLRAGVVLASQGGALAQMVPVFRWCLGGPIGSGRQMMPWVALDDLIGVICRCIGDESLSGPLNVCAGALPNREFTRHLARAVGRPAWFPVPGFVISLLFGEMGRTVLLGGQDVVPAKLQAIGHRFAMPLAEDAMRFELGNLTD